MCRSYQLGQTKIDANRPTITWRWFYCDEPEFVTHLREGLCSPNAFAGSFIVADSTGAAGELSLCATRATTGTVFLWLQLISGLNCSSVNNNSRSISYNPNTFVC